MIMWPRGVHLLVCDEHKCFVETSKNRKYDLNDELFQTWRNRTIYLEVQVNNKNWGVWDTEALKWIEKRIRWDLKFDGNHFSLRRYTRRRGHPCSEGFVWKLTVE